MIWICTKCAWKGEHKDCKHVMFKGVDWEQCPSCEAVAIPQKASGLVNVDFKSSRFGDLAKLTRPIKVRELSFPVYVTEFGSFVAELTEDDWVQAPSYAELTPKLEKVVEQRSKQVSIPFCVFTVRNGIRKGVVRGIHAGTGGFLVTWDDGVKEALSKHTTFYELPSAQDEADIKHKVSQVGPLLDSIKALEPPKFESSVMAEHIKAAMAPKEKT